VRRSHKALSTDLSSIEDNYIEVFVDCSIEECEKRDVKGLYKKVREAKISDFTGISSDFEIPNSPDIILNTEKNNIEFCLNQLINKVGII
jgi:adenylylsulfate kinase-like enzyme